MYERIVDVLRAKSYVMGVRFWSHMGQTQSSIFTDSSGTILPGAKNTKNAVQRAVPMGNAAFGSRAKVT